jgi:TetR/AcrR family transcriptional repressor of lmrAB and yxaGH operons
MSTAGSLKATGILLCQMASLDVSPQTTRVDIAVNMAAPKSIIAQDLEAISVVPFARTIAEIEVAGAHLSMSCAAICESVVPDVATYGSEPDSRDTAGIYYGDRHSMSITIAVSSHACYADGMPRKTDARDRAIATAERLFRIQGYTATGLSQIIEESGSPKGSFYFHFPRGKAQLAEEAIDHYVATRMAVLRAISANTTGDALSFIRQIFGAFAAEMVASDFQYGCLMQNLANELPALDAELTKRVARGFADSTEIVAEHFRGCGFTSARASSTASALVAAVEGARTIARLQRTAAIFDALADVSVQGWAAPEGRPEVSSRRRGR